MIVNDSKKAKQFKFSFVMPVYNVEKYLEETVESIVKQSIGFEKNCEIIFVNDGSPDNVEEICLRYVEAFPNNVVYIRQVNKGVSAARNEGLKHARGSYISFLDSDDLLSANALEEVNRFFDKYYNEVDLVSIPLDFFEAKIGGHMLNYKYYSTRIIDIEREYDCPQLSAASAFIKRQMFDEYHFDEKVQVSEDVKIITEIILNKMRYGVVSNATYYYRKRSTSDSAISKSQINRSWYSETIERVYIYLLDYSRQKTGKIPKYIQYMIMYDIQWRFKQPSQDVLNRKEQSLYKASLVKLLQDIQESIIFEQRYTNAAQKLFILEKKYKSCSEDLTKRVYEKYSPPVWIEFIEVQDSRLTLEGHINFSLKAGYDLYFDVNGVTKKVSRTTRVHRETQFLGEEIYDGGGYQITLDISEFASCTIHAYLATKEGRKMDVLIQTRRFSKLANKSKGYRIAGNYIIIKKDSGLQVESYSRSRHIYREFVWQVRILASLRLRESYELLRYLKHGVTPNGRRLTNKDKIKPFTMPIVSALRNIGTVWYRICYYIAKVGQTRPIWILSDRTTAAGDNGEALFRYLSTRKDLKIRVYFAVSKKSPDYARLKKFGKVLHWGGFRYKIFFLLSDKVISSHADDFVINPYRHRLKDVQDLYNFDYVFLQHGITKDDISGWLNRYNKNIALFVSAARPEYQSLLEPNYGYSKKQVALTGFPRYDLLKNNPKNKIIIAPTWRKMLAEEANQKTGTRDYDPLFKESGYYRFYQSILDDKSLQQDLDKYDMTIEFYLHPSHAKQVGDFKGHERAIIKSMPYDYKVAFAEGSILITDYSSVAFDFAYLKKPVIYTQFDKEEFFEGHLYSEGYFSYSDDGFGPVVANLKDTVSAIRQSLRSDCVMNSNYVDRVERFFYKFDDRNSKRVTDRIEAL